MRYHTLARVAGPTALAIVVVIFISAVRSDRERTEPTFDDYPSEFVNWNATRLVACHDSITRQAANWWTKQTCPRAIRCTEFSYANVWRDDFYGVDHDIVLANDYNAGAAFDPAPPGRVVYWIPAPGTIDEEFRIIVHELGHSLGLAHDPGSEMSPMSPRIHPTKPLLLSHEDRQALKGRFCP